MIPFSYTLPVPPEGLVPIEVAGNTHTGQAAMVAEPAKQLLSHSPTAPFSSEPATDACPVPGNSRQLRPPPGHRTRDWILALEVAEILAHVPPFRSVLRRFFGSRGADLLFLGTSLAGLLLPFHASGSMDVVALCMVAARFALGFLIEPWWIDLLFGVTGIAMFLVKRRRHRRALVAG